MFFPRECEIGLAVPLWTSNSVELNLKEEMPNERGGIAA